MRQTISKHTIQQLVTAIWTQLQQIRRNVKLAVATIVLFLGVTYCFFLANGPDTQVIGTALLPPVENHAPAQPVSVAPPAKPAVEAEPKRDVKEPETEEARTIGSGEASYYGAEFAGRPTANGETFNPAEMTAAHRTLPFGSKVRVTNVETGKSVVVRINDRGPYAENRLIDVSKSAARQLEMIASGTARVELELIG